MRKGRRRKINGIAKPGTRTCTVWRQSRAAGCGHLRPKHPANARNAKGVHGSRQQQAAASRLSRNKGGLIWILCRAGAPGRNIPRADNLGHSKAIPS